MTLDRDLFPVQAMDEQHEEFEDLEEEQDVELEIVDGGDDADLEGKLKDKLNDDLADGFGDDLEEDDFSDDLEDDDY